jgi:general secretion pathway protein F
MGLDALVALNDEMAALVRAGVPLEQGLTELARDLPGRTGAVAARLGDRLAAGESLEDVLGGEEAVFPPVWRAVVAAGVRSGHLAAALEGLSKTGRQIGEMRRAVGMALIYPLVVTAIAYGLFLVTLVRLAPLVAGAIEDMRRSTDPLLAAMVWLGQTASSWAIWPPLIFLVVLAVAWYRSGRAAWRRSGSGTSRGTRWVGFPWPTLGRLVSDGRLATFADVLSLLVRQQIPLAESVVLAAEASGDQGLKMDAMRLADRLRAGGGPAGSQAGASPIPPLVGWLLSAGGPVPALAQSLALTAEIYRQRAQRTVTWAVVYLPIVLSVVLGGTATLIQALAVFVPLSRLWYQLGMG